MNSLAPIEQSQNGILAAMAFPVAANAVPQSPAFINMMGLLLSTPTQTTSLSTDVPVTTATPSQLADSMIRSMLGNLSSPTGASAGQSAPQPAADTSVSPAQLADAMIRSMLGSLKPMAASSAPTATDKGKTLRSTADLPALATLVAPQVASPTPTPADATQPASTTGNSNMTISAPQPTVPPPPAAPLVKGDIAFTAILTPANNTSLPTRPEPIAIPSAANIGHASTAAVSNSVQPAPGQTPQAAIPVAGKDSTGAQAGGDMQQGADTDSQSQDDSAPRATPSPGAKIKPADNKQDDSAASAVRISDVPVEALTSFPEQTRAAAIQQPEAAPAPTPSQSAAETIRTSEPNVVGASPARTGAAQEISIRIAPPDSAPVDLRVIERSGQVHVDVRTSDPSMQTALRQDLGTLTNSLEKAGYHSETFTPASNLNRAASSAQMSNQDDQQDPSKNNNGSGDFSGGRRQQQQQKRPSTWLEEMEDQK